jgi:hypothetical protein
MAQTIQEVFKEFCKERHAEDKGKNYDLLQSIYASTEFFDTSLYEIVGIPINLSKQGKDYVTSFTIENFSLPFQNNFIRVGDSIYVYIREYLPNVLTGTVYTIVEKGVHLNIPYTIRLGEGSATIFSDLNVPKFFNADSLMTQTFHIIIGVCMTLSELSHKAVAVDKPSNPNLCEYYRRKRKPTIKIPQRPIYYILGEKQEDVTPKYKSIRPVGNLEYSFTFKVRGHWRHINEGTLGKDRNGNYNVHGYTWVTEYTKGEGELAKRIRVIK